MIPWIEADVRILRKYFWLSLLPALAVMVALQVASMRDESATGDEDVHLASGYRALRTGSYELFNDHPPLQRLLNAVPLLLLLPPLPDQSKLHPNAKLYTLDFLYGGPMDADTLLFYGRLPSVLLSVLLVCSVAFVARRHFGLVAALLSAYLCALDPNLVAHGRYITTDIAGALFFFIAISGKKPKLRYSPSPISVASNFTVGIPAASHHSKHVPSRCFASPRPR